LVRLRVKIQRLQRDDKPFSCLHILIQNMSCFISSMTTLFVCGQALSDFLDQR
jgi:hypothetical protein